MGLMAVTRGGRSSNRVRQGRSQHQGGGLGHWHGRPSSSSRLLGGPSLREGSRGCAIGWS